MSTCQDRPGRALLAVDLFAGCGGLTLGLKQAGFRVIAAVENSAVAVETYKLNHADVPWVYDVDIRTVTGERILGDAGLKIGELDLLAGCPPCQAFSRMKTKNGGRQDPGGRRLAADMEGMDLVNEYLRLVEELQPRALLMENVPALQRDERYRRLRARVEELGFLVNDAVHDAAAFGVPQRRRRLIMLAARGVRPELPQKAGPEGRKTVRDTIADWSGTAGISGDPAHDLPSRRTARIEERIRSIPHDGGSRRDLGPEAQLDCHRKFNGFGDVYGRMRWDDVSPTITGGFPNPSKGRFIHPTEDRPLTLREGALLQTFPADFRFPTARGKYPVAEMIGNALPPVLAKAHASAIAEMLHGEFG